MDQPIHVLSVNSLNEDQLGRLRAVSPRLVIEQHPANSPEEIEQALTDQTEVLYVAARRFDTQRAPNLRWIQVDSAGVNHLQDTPVWNSDIAITSANGVHAVQLAEYTLMMLLAHGHHLPLAQRMQARHEWASSEQRPLFLPNELRGMTLGIVGYGAIGREVARLATAFGVRVLATKRADKSPHFDGWTPEGTGDPEGRLPERYYPLEELHSLLEACDAVLLTLPLTDSTHHIIGPAELAVMRPHALLINIGRGLLVDQAALIDALQNDRLGGAALDVTDPEPLPADSPLWSMDNVILTPHIGGTSPRYDDRAVELFAENLRRYLAGEQLLNQVQRDLGY